MNLETTTDAPVANPCAAKCTPFEQVGCLLKTYSDLSLKVAAAKSEMQAAVKPLVEEMEKVAATLTELATEHRPALFGTSKTLGFEFGTIGFRLGDKKLVLPEGLNMQWMMQAVKDAAPGAVEEKLVDKKLVDALAVLPDLAASFRKRGIKVEQKDGFFITPKKADKPS